MVSATVLRTCYVFVGKILKLLIKDALRSRPEPLSDGADPGGTVFDPLPVQGANVERRGGREGRI